MRALVMVALVLSAPAVATEVRPGKWQATMTIENMSMPGMPENVLAMMKGRPTTTTYCMTPEEAKADPKKMMDAESKCKFNRFNLSGGKMSAEMVCQTEQGPATMMVDGAYTETSYETRASMKTGQMTMVSRNTAKWLGPCK